MVFKYSLLNLPAKKILCSNFRQFCNREKFETQKFIMSNTSVTATKRDRLTSELQQELEAVSNLIVCLRSQLDNLYNLRRSLEAVNKNCQEMVKINNLWVDTIYEMKQ